MFFSLGAITKFCDIDEIIKAWEAVFRNMLHEQKLTHFLIVNKALRDKDVECKESTAL